jgi:hypothetical protein
MIFIISHVILLLRAGFGDLHTSKRKQISIAEHQATAQNTMKLKEIHRTSTFAWSPMLSLPLLATGTVAGALDESFINESKLEIWAPDFLDKHEFDLGGQEQHGPKGVVLDTARYLNVT